MIPELQVAYNQLFRPAEPLLNIFSSGLVAPNCIKSPKPAKSKKLQWLGENRYNVCFVTLSIVFGTSSPLTMCGLGKYCYVFFVLLSYCLIVLLCYVFFFSFLLFSNFLVVVSVFFVDFLRFPFQGAHAESLRRDSCAASVWFVSEARKVRDEKRWRDG